MTHFPLRTCTAPSLSALMCYSLNLQTGRRSAFTVLNRGVKDTVRSPPVTYMLYLSIIPYVLNADGARVRANTASVALNNRTRRPARPNTLNPPLSLRPRDWQHSGRPDCMVDIYVYNVPCGGGGSSCCLSRNLCSYQSLLHLFTASTDTASGRHGERREGAQRGDGRTKCT